MCSLNSFQDKLKDLHQACCDPHDIDDECDENGVPVNCDYECANELPAFFPACRHLVGVLTSAVNVHRFEKLQRTCQALPARPLILAISSVTHCNKSTCNDSKWNGDEVKLDCGGSCTRACNYNTTLVRGQGADLAAAWIP